MSKHKRRHAKMMGCKTCTPFACAIAPTAKGTIDAPDDPIAEQMPTAGTCNDFGRRVVRQTITPGNIGPRKNPKLFVSTGALSVLIKLTQECCAHG